MTDNKRIINSKKADIEGRKWVGGDKQKVTYWELFSKFAFYYLRGKYI